MSISIIVAVSDNNVIGINNDLPWNIPTDLKRFKSLTENSVVIMGRKCWESLPDKNRPLKNRTNIVLSKNIDYVAPGAKVYNDLKSAINDNIESNIFIIGGNKLYEQSFDISDKLYLTRIKGDIEGDVYLNNLDLNQWEVVEQSEMFNENGYCFNFIEYKKIKKISLGIIGSRTFNDYEFLKTCLNEYKDKADVVVSGGAKGADSLGEKWANEMGIKKYILKPDWKKFGRSAGFIRNRDIVSNSDLIIAFWDGKSSGTKHSIDLAFELKKDILVINV